MQSAPLATKAGCPSTSTATPPASSVASAALVRTPPASSVVSAALVRTLPRACVRSRPSLSVPLLQLPCAIPGVWPPLVDWLLMRRAGCVQISPPSRVRPLGRCAAHSETRAKVTSRVTAPRATPTPSVEVRPGPPVACFWSNPFVVSRPPWPPCCAVPWCSCSRAIEEVRQRTRRQT